MFTPTINEVAGETAVAAVAIVERSIPITLGGLTDQQRKDALEAVDRQVAEAVFAYPDDFEPYDLTEITLLAIEAVTCYVTDCACFGDDPDNDECICLDIARRELGVNR